MLYQKAVILSLEKAGVIKPEMVGKEKRILGRGQKRSPACFSTSNHWEISVKGKKLAGSAQRRLSRAFLQHGSILLDKDPELAHSLLRYFSDSAKEQELRNLTSNTLTLNEILPVNLEWGKLAQCFEDGFRETFSGSWKSGPLSSLEMELVEKYLQESE